MARYITDTIDAAQPDHLVSNDAMRWTPEPNHPEPVRLNLHFDSTRMSVAVAELRRTVLQFGQLAAAATHSMAVMRLQPRARRRHRARCRQCNTQANPPACGINGHAYHRRRQARRRRVRRRRR